MTTVTGTDMRQRLRLLECQHAELLAHARAAVAAARRGELDPTGYIACLLEERGQLPPPEATPGELLAQAHECGALVEAALGGGERS
ncbi:hypothetical protein [Actinoallomurus sp. CA-150999]|uniref:hypothetical protein n=1 Tax=Actinoallomurus sp. CA-150999 TaxID=3239887 RepID=UPI003D8AF798